MTPEDIRSYLGSVAKRPSDPTPDAVRDALAALKREALASGDQAGAKSIWCLEQALRIQEHYLQSFALLKAGEYYKAWCELELTEHALAGLERHDTTCWTEFWLDFIAAYTAKWQSLFPYKLFISPELLQTEKVCSVCNQPVLPQSFCGHRVGEIYNGEMCYRTVTKLEALGLSVVDKPVQKYSVLFLRNEKEGTTQDQYRYELVEFPIKALREPFDAWDVERTTRRQPHARFADVGRNDPCPCESGKKYKKCCLRESGVLRPHYEYTFDVPPPDGTVQEMFIK